MAYGETGKGKAFRGGAQARQMVGECQRGALTATPHDGSGPNGPRWSLWSSNYGEVSVVSHTKGGNLRVGNPNPRTGRVLGESDNYNEGLSPIIVRTHSHSSTY